MSQVIIATDENSRIADLISASGGFSVDPIEAKVMDFCQRMSGQVRLGYVGDKLVCCWGLIPTSILSNQAYLWLYTTPEVQAHRFLFVRHSQRQIEEMLTHYEIITGHCKITATESIRWIKWLGGTFGEYEGDRVPFIIRRH